MGKLRARYQSDVLGQAKPLLGVHILPCKINSFDLQITSQIDKRMRKLEWILNTIVNISVLVIFCCLHILSMLTILTKSSTWDAWLGPAGASASRYNTAFKTQVGISLWQQV